MSEARLKELQKELPIISVDPDAFGADLPQNIPQVND